MVTTGQDSTVERDASRPQTERRYSGWSQKSRPHTSAPGAASNLQEPIRVGEVHSQRPQTSPAVYPDFRASRALSVPGDLDLKEENEAISDPELQPRSRAISSGAIPYQRASASPAQGSPAASLRNSSSHYHGNSSSESEVEIQCANCRRSTVPEQKDFEKDFELDGCDGRRRSRPGSTVIYQDGAVISTLRNAPSRPPHPLRMSTSTLLGSTVCATPVGQVEELWGPKKDGSSKGDSALDISTVRVSKFGVFETLYDDSEYKIDKVHESDDFDHLPNWKRRLTRLSPFFTFLAIGSYILYLVMRVRFTVQAQQHFGHVYIIAWFFITTEGLIAIPGFLHQFWQILAFKGRRRPKLRLIGEVVPTVDVLITTCGEDVDVILDTTRAACALDYPTNRFRVVVLDDAANTELQNALEDLPYPNLHYHARIKEKGKPHHFKAGNLMGGTAFVEGLKGGAGEFMACLDADMIPEADWLRAIMAHLVLDDRLALACPPQLFYNVPKNDPLCQNLDVFVHVMETSKDATGVAWCTGSGYGLRKAALEDIGGWPLGSIAEDVCMSSMLLGRGWRTAYVHEPLQYGTVPDDFLGHVKQRTRWTLGTLQTATKLRLCLFGSLARRMTFYARLSGFIFTISSFFTLLSIVAMVTIPVVLISGGTLVAFTSIDDLRWQTRWCFISVLCARINEWISYLPAGYRTNQRGNDALMWMAPYHAITIIRSFILPKWLGGKAAAFSATGSLKCALNERDARLRAPLHRRVKVILWDCKAYLHVMYGLFILAAVGLSSSRAFPKDMKNFDLLTMWHYLLTHAFWPPMIWVWSFSACLVPLMYAIWPPTMPDREDTLDRDAKGIAHPKEEWKQQRWGKKNTWYDLQNTFLMAYTSLIFALSFVV